MVIDLCKEAINKIINLSGILTSKHHKKAEDTSMEAVLKQHYPDCIRELISTIDVLCKQCFDEIANGREYSFHETYFLSVQKKTSLQIEVSKFYTHEDEKRRLKTMIKVIDGNGKILEFIDDKLL